MDYFKGEEGVEAIFEYSIRHTTLENDHILFAYTYPYPLSDFNYSIKEVQTKCE